MVRVAAAMVVSAVAAVAVAPAAAAATVAAAAAVAAVAAAAATVQKGAVVAVEWRVARTAVLPPSNWWTSGPSPDSDDKRRKG